MNCDHENEDYCIVSNLSCPKCHSIVDVYYPSNKLIKEYQQAEDRTYENEKWKIVRKELWTSLEQLMNF